MTSNESVPTDNLVNNLAQHIELQDIFFESFSATLKRLAEPQGLQLKVTGSCARQPNTILFRYTTNCNLRGEPKTVDAPQASTPDKIPATDDELGETLAELTVVVVCQFIMQEDLDAPDDSTLDEFSEDVGYRLAFPYIRESLSSMISKLGFPAMTFGLLRPGKSIPGAFGRRPGGSKHESP